MVWRTICDDFCTPNGYEELLCKFRLLEGFKGRNGLRNVKRKSLRGRILEAKFKEIVFHAQRDSTFRRLDLTVIVKEFNYRDALSATKGRNGRENYCGELSLIWRLTETFITLKEVDTVLSEACVGLIYDTHLSLHRIHWPIGAYPASLVESRLLRAFCLPPLTIMDSFDLQALPFDVVVLVFQFLDRRSLLAACLTSKSFHELATPLLYEDVQLGPSPRCPLSHNVV